MGKCIKCGNEYDKSFDIVKNGKSFTFDSFECAINELAPRCKHCGCVVIGHGVEDNGTIYCCAHCAGENGKNGFVDRN
jgi:Rieske Fe-S protein